MVILQKTLIIVGGANGSGKTTLAQEFVSAEQIKYLGADDIARELNSEQPEQVAIEAARIFSQRLNDSLEQGESLSGLSLRKWIGKARNLDYGIKIVFVYLDSPELCVQRIAARVARGGHYVPEDDVRRRFSRSNRNFWNAYKDLADKWSLFFNAGDNLEQVAFQDKNGVIIIDEERYKKWLLMVETEATTEQ